MQELPENTRVLYTQLITDCLSGFAPSGRGLSFVGKTIKGKKHWYLQLTVGSKKTQHFLGPDSGSIRQVMVDERNLWKHSKPDLQRRQKLVAMLLAGGAHAPDAAEARVLEVLEKAGVFLAGGVLVGSHAYFVYGNMLGVQWAGPGMRTYDIDIAAVNHIVLGMPQTTEELKTVLINSKLGFIEVPALNRKSPSTRFRIRGKQLSVDLLTPLHGKPVSTPIRMASLKAFAEPVRFLDYLLADTQSAVIVAKGGILVNVPTPARYALHKLVISVRRIPAMHTKASKDLDQATQLIAVLLDQRPGDLRLAWDSAQDEPARFVSQMKDGMKRLGHEVRDGLRDLLGFG